MAPRDIGRLCVGPYRRDRRHYIRAQQQITGLLGEVRARSSGAATEHVIRELLERLVANDRAAAEEKERLIRAVRSQSPNACAVIIVTDWLRRAGEGRSADPVEVDSGVACDEPLEKPPVGRLACEFVVGRAPSA